MRAQWGQLTPVSRLGRGEWASSLASERGRAAPETAERARTWGLDRRSVFVRLVPRRVPRQSHRLEFARARVRFEKNCKRTFSAASPLSRSLVAPRRQGERERERGNVNAKRESSDDKGDSRGKLTAERISRVVAAAQRRRRTKQRQEGRTRLENVPSSRAVTRSRTGDRTTSSSSSS